MSLLEKLTGGLRGTGNRPLLEGTLAAAALVACADRQVTLAKRNTLVGLLSAVEAFQGNDLAAAVETFDGYVDQLFTDKQSGKAAAIKAIRILFSDRAAGEIALKVAGQVSVADGPATAAATARLCEIAYTVGLTPPEPESLESLPPPTPQTPQPATSRFGPAPPDPSQTVVIERYGDLAGRKPEPTVAAEKRPIYIAVGNEKGGSGKSTTAMLLIVGLMRQGYKVGSLDLDGKQATLSRYLANRVSFAQQSGQKLKVPVHRRLEPVGGKDRAQATLAEKCSFFDTLFYMKDCDFVVIDTPGHGNHLSQLGHAQADILITPMNDSFLDIDVLAKIDPQRREVLSPSAYCERIWAENERRLSDGRPPLAWIVMRNRLAQLDSHNNREMAGLLGQLAKRMGFRVQPGLSERVIYRELFYRGLTLQDLPRDRQNPETQSLRRARQEVEELLAAVQAVDVQNTLPRPFRTPAEAVDIAPGAVAEGKIEAGRITAAPLSTQ